MKSLYKHLALSCYRITVKSYGIPELHRLYNWLTACVTNKKQKFATKDCLQHDELYNVTKKEPSASIFKKTIILLNYYGGRPFGLGDKLEVMIERKY